MLLSLVSLYVIGREVWVAQVFANMPNPINVLALVHFIEVAFLNTTTLVQVLCVAIVFSAIWLVRDVAKSIQLPRFA